MRLAVGLGLGFAAITVLRLTGLDRAIVLICATLPAGYNSILFSATEELDEEYAVTLSFNHHNPVDTTASGNIRNSVKQNHRPCLNINVFITSNRFYTLKAPVKIQRAKGGCQMKGSEIK